MKNADKPAFSMQAYSDEQFGPVNQEPGLTKREYFAAMAIQGLCANPNVSSNKMERDTAQFYSKCAINMADELLKQLEK